MRTIIVSRWDSKTHHWTWLSIFDTRESVTGEIKYRFALDNTGKTVDVFSLQNKTNILGRTFSCLGCKEPVIAKLGNDVTHHFSHKSNFICSGETYLHKLAKAVFAEEYEKCLRADKPFELELEQRKTCNHYPGFSEGTCSTKPRPQKHNLTLNYQTLRVEVERDEFKPDITLESKNGKNDVWVEIAVTHKCSTAKLKSGKRIIEIVIASEDDLLPIRNHLLSFQDTRIVFHNFRKNIPQDMCPWFSYCRLGKKVFRLFKNGNYDVRYLEKNDDSTEKNQDVVWFKEFFEDRHNQASSLADWEYDLDATVKDCFFDALESGHTIKSCQFCEHFDAFGDKECRKLDQRVPCRSAIDCEHFSVVDDYDDLMGRCADGF